MQLSVEEPAAVARHAAPIFGGIPLPWGVYSADQKFSVFSGTTEMPAQLSPLVVDEKCYLRWILINFLADVPANGNVSFTLKDVASSAVPPQLTYIHVGNAEDGQKD